jgi:hypothetical protein
MKGHVTEHFVDSDKREVMCPQCLNVAFRQVPAPRCQLDGCSGDFPSASMAWEQRRESHMRKERKNQENHGTYD